MCSKIFWRIRRLLLYLHKKHLWIVCILHIRQNTFGVFSDWSHLQLRISEGSPTRDFWLQVLFMNQFPPGPWISQWGHFKDKLSPVSLFPAIICCRFHWHRWLSRVPGFCYKFHDNGDYFIAGNNDTKNNFINGVVNTGDKPLLSNISGNFCKNSKWINGILRRRNWLMKNPEVENLAADSMEIRIRRKTFSNACWLWQYHKKIYGKIIFWFEEIIIFYVLATFEK